MEVVSGSHLDREALSVPNHSTGTVIGPQVDSPTPRNYAGGSSPPSATVPAPLPSVSVFRGAAPFRALTDSEQPPHTHFSDSSK